MCNKDYPTYFHEFVPHHEETVVESVGEEVIRLRKELEETQNKLNKVTLRNTAIKTEVERLMNHYCGLTDKVDKRYYEGASALAHLLTWINGL